MQQSAHPDAGVSASADAHHADSQDAALTTLLARACSGESRAWTDLVNIYAPRLFAFARARCKDAELAEEVTQSVLCTVALKLREGGYQEQGKFDAWLFRIAVNRIRDAARARKRKPATWRDGYDIAETNQPSTVQNAGVRSLRAALETLSPLDREVIELRHHAGLSFRAIADLLEEPLGTLLARHHRALRKLKESLESQGYSAQSGEAK
jgi:RNA polymerase sigma-70 factor (ECF subfamily)